MTPDTRDPHADSPCGLLRRLLAMTYDSLIVLALLMLAGFIALPFTGPDTRAGQDILFTLYLLLVWFSYFAWCWKTTGATLGMRAWRIRLISERGGQPGWAACALRFVTAMVSGLAVGAGFLRALFDPQRRCWHDLASGSRLIVLERPSDRAA